MRWLFLAVLITYLIWESYKSKRLSGRISGSLSIYTKSLLRFSLVTVAMSTMSRLPVNTQRSPEFTRLRLSRQKGHDWDLDRLQFIAAYQYFQVNVNIKKQSNNQIQHRAEIELGTCIWQQHPENIINKNNIQLMSIQSGPSKSRTQKPFVFSACSRPNNYAFYLHDELCKYHGEGRNEGWQSRQTRSRNLL